MPRNAGYTLDDRDSVVGVELLLRKASLAVTAVHTLDPFLTFQAEDNLLLIGLGSIVCSRIVDMDVLGRL